MRQYHPLWITASAQELAAGNVGRVFTVGRFGNIVVPKTLYEIHPGAEGGIIDIGRWV